MAGYFLKSLDVDSVHLTESNGGDGAGFVMELDHATGKAVWGVATANNGGSVEWAHDVAVDASGDVYVTGAYNGQAVFGGITVQGTTSDKAIFVAKYSPKSSSWLWAKGWGGVQNGTNDGGVGYGVAVTSGGDVYATGSISGSALVEGVPLDADGGSFVVKLGASDGHLVWVTQIAPTGQNDSAEAVAATVDASGAVYFAGNYDGSPVFQSATAGDSGAGSISVTTTSGGTDAFLAKLDPDGTPAWVKHGGTTMPATARADDVAFDGKMLYVSGFKQGDTVFDSMKLTTSSDLFVAKYDTTGAIQWVQGAKSTTSDSAEGLSLSVPSPTSAVTVGGTYVANVTFGTTRLTSSGQDDAFVTRACN